jgi:hypothetical protein
MIVNFRAREISRGARKLMQTSTLIKKNIHILKYNIFLGSHVTLKIGPNNKFLGLHFNIMM